MRKKARKGDVVWLDGWSGIIGIFDRYDSKHHILYLSFPQNLKWRYDYDRGEAREFIPVRPDQFRVLSAKETLEKLSLVFEAHLNALAGDLSVKVAEAVKRLVI